MTRCWNNCGVHVTFDDSIRSRKSGKRIPLNLDGTLHECPNSSYKKKHLELHSDSNQVSSNRAVQNSIIADKQLQKEKISNAINYINGLNDRLPDFNLELIVKEKGGA